jgi:hypothetical protein
MGERLTTQELALAHTLAVLEHENYMQIKHTKYSYLMYFIVYLLNSQHKKMNIVLFGIHSPGS